MIRLNSNEELVKEIQQALIKNQGFCPCKLDHIPDNKCMCKEFRNQEFGQCHCGLYVKIS